jgi:hypothetical protein
VSADGWFKLAGCIGVGATAAAVGVVAGPAAAIVAGIGAALTCIPAAMHRSPLSPRGVTPSTEEVTPVDRGAVSADDKRKRPRER